MASPHTSCRTSRSDLLSLLSQACEFEHGLSCAYLFTSFSLKQEIHEGLNFRQQQLARRWAADIFAVAAEEMLHLAQVWNLIAAVGGNPYYWRPGFPVSSKYYPTGLPISLEPFSVETLERYIQFELPFENERQEVCSKHKVNLIEGSGEYGSVAELYTIIAEMIAAIPEDELFVGSKSRQVDHELVDFPTLIRVSNRKSALDAIALIKEQGEGMEVTSNTQSEFEELDVDRDGHYGVFVRILREYRDELKRDPNADVVRNVVPNPIASERAESGINVATKLSDAASGHLIQDPYTKEVGELFDRAYLLMLRLLQYIFRNSTDDSVVLRQFAKTAIGIMTTLIKPLAESLMLLPMGKGFGNLMAGPGFGLSRHVTLPENQTTAAILVRERLQELINHATQIAEDDRAPSQLVNSQRNLEYWLEQVNASTTHQP